MAKKNKKINDNSWSEKFFREHEDIRFKFNLLQSLTGPKRKCNPLSGKLKKKIYNKLKKLFDPDNTE